MMNRKDLKYILILLPISIFAFFSNIWVRPADLMEARNFITAREMVENNNFLIPTLNGFLRFEKPPLPTWFTAGIMKLTGNMTDEYILRIPVAICSVLFIILLYYFMKLLTKDSFKSFLVAFVGTTTFMLIKIGNENTWDIYTYIFAFGAITFILKGFQEKKTRDFIIGGIFLAGSILSKGPVGIYGLVIPFLISYTAVFGFKDLKLNLKKIFLMVFIATVLSSVWAIVVYSKYPDIFLSVLKKEEKTWSTRHTESFIYYIDYFVYMGVWIFFSFMAVIYSWSRKRNSNKNISKFIFLWNILVILFLSFIKMKKKRYGIPIYMTSAMSVGIICEYYYNKIWNELKKSDRILLNVQGIFMCVISFAIPIILFLKGYMIGSISLKYMLMIFIIFISFGVLTLNFIVRKKELSIKFIIFGSGILMLITNISTNWFFDRNFIKKTNELIEYQKIKVVRKNPPISDVYGKYYEIEDVWRIGKNIKNYDENTNLPNEFIFFGDVPEEILDNYKIYKKEIYVKDDGNLAELSYLEKQEV